MSQQGFDPKDLEEICSRKPEKFKMKKADFKELGINTLKGSLDIAVGVGIVLTAVLAAGSSKKHSQSEDPGYSWEEEKRPYESENRHQ